MEAEDLVFDEIMGRWIPPSEYNEFINVMLTETEHQHKIKNGVESNLTYSEYNLKVIREITKEKYDR
jgi:hypothetical protein